MSDGDGKDSLKFLSEKDSQLSTRKSKKGDELAQSIARIAVAQVCEGLGFQTFQQSALDTLADVAVRYIKEIGRIANLNANTLNRSNCNVFDVILGLEDLGSIQGFSGASVISHSLSESGVVKDMMHYVAQAEEIPFAYSIPGFPVVKERKLNPSFAQVEENSPDEHIPNWLPRFPEPGTYTDLNSGNEEDSETRVDEKIQQVQVQKKVERPSMNFQQKFSCNGSEAGVAVEQGDSVKAQRAVESNPFLASPLRFGEKEVSLLVIPAKLLDEGTEHHQCSEVVENRVEDNKSARTVLCETEDRRKILLNGRPSVKFKFGNGKKSLGMSLSPKNEGVGKISLWFADDHDGKDEKGRRAEQIFCENTECPQEVSQ